MDFSYRPIIPPIHCTGTTQCASYFLPGTVYDMNPSPSTFTGHPEATTVVVKNSIGYQIEFYSLSSTDNFVDAECKAYGADSRTGSVGIFICLKQSGNDLIAGASFEINFV